MVYPEGLGPDALTVLNDYLQRNATTSLLSWEMQQSGSDHAAYWTAIAMINGVEYGRGGGMRAKDARNAAARQVISAIEKEPMTIRRRRGKSPESETDGLDQRWSYQSAVPSDSASQSRFAESTAERKDSRVPEADGNIAPESDASSVHQYPPHGSHCKGVGSNASAEPPVGSASVGQIQRDQDHLRSFGRDTEVPTDTFELKLHLKPQCHVSTVIDRSWHDEKLRLCLVSTYNEMRDPWRRWIFARKLRSISLVKYRAPRWCEAVQSSLDSYDIQSEASVCSAANQTSRALGYYLENLVLRDSQHGLEFIESWSMAPLIMICLLGMLLSTIFALWYGHRFGDYSGGFTIAAYAGGLIGILLLLLQIGMVSRS